MPMTMNRRQFLGAGAAALCPLPVWGQQTHRKPNIVLIAADDLGIGDLGCFGQQRLRTPNIDRLALKGTRFTQVYSGSTVCAPSRCALMTGMHTGHCRVRDNTPQVALRPGDITVAAVLKRAGYRTAILGKWGLGNPGTTGIPNLQGFDDWYGYLNQDHAHFYYPQHLWDNERESFLRGNRGNARQQYAPDLFIERALSFLERYKEGPFFLYLATTLPHFSDYDLKSPMGLDVPSDAPYSAQDWPQIEKNYAAMVTRLDGHVGRLLAQMKRLGIENDTLVFFTSDNGPSAETAHRPDFFDSNGPFRGVKRDMYEGAIRVPMIVRWPGVVPAGRVSDHPWAFWDFLPTAAELAGGRIPDGIDGVSVVPTLRGGSQQPHTCFYWEYGHVREKFMQGVRAGDWKAVRNSARLPVELYNLREDPGETRNVAVRNPEIVSRLEALMRTERTDSDEFPVREASGV